MGPDLAGLMEGQPQHCQITIGEVALDQVLPASTHCQWQAQQSMPTLIFICMHLMECLHLLIILCELECGAVSDDNLAMAACLSGGVINTFTTGLGVRL